MSSKRFLIPALIAACLLGATPAALAADGEPWLVGKSSGEVWVTTPGAAQVSLGGDQELKPGDMIRTGPSGRVRLTRGAETIVIAPNSEVGLPAAAKDGMATTILQRAGSILLDVEKRNVQHFEVETPYLAAVVKGTQFSVTISGRSTKVEVSRGQVQVSDFKTGQIAQVMPGQAATTFANGRTGLSLSGAGAFSPIEQGRPRAPTIDRIPVPRDGLHAPREAKGNLIHALNANSAAPRPGGSVPPQQHSATSVAAKPNVVRISASIGEVNLNIQKATRGLAHGAHAASGGSGRSTAWSEARGGNGNTPSNSATSNGTSGDSSVAAAITAAIGSPTASATPSLAAINSGGDSGNGSSGGKSNGGGNNGNGGGNGNSGNGGNGNGNGGNSGNSGHGNGNGNGNGNSGHGNAYGHNKN
ncbi:MAG: FecR family protein [Bradyrhizobium sp.]